MSTSARSITPAMVSFVTGALVLFACFSNVVWAEPILRLNEPRDINMAKYSCDWAENEIKRDQYLIKAFQCTEVELCNRAIQISAACKVTGPAADVGAFHSKLLAQFASNSRCKIEIMRLTYGKTTEDVKRDLQAYQQANWELNLGFTPGAETQEWSLWPQQSQNGGKPLEGEGTPAKIANDVCTILTGTGAKILN